MRLFWNRCGVDPKSIMRSIRVFAGIIILMVLAAKFDWLTRETTDLLTFLMALYILSWSWREYLVKNPKMRMWLLGVLIALVFVGALLLALRG